MLGYSEVYRGNDAAVCSRIKDVLSAEGIKWKDRCENTNGGNFSDRNRGTGNLGINTSVMYTYSVYVKKADAEQAIYLIHKEK